MSDTPDNTLKVNGEAPSINVVTQYIKDLSYESPKVPNALRTQARIPAINIGVNVGANPVPESEGEYDVRLTLSARAGEGAETLFHVELVYGGVFRLAKVPQEHLLPVLFIECPRLLFPFARQIVADVSRSGGFPPLMIDPIDFGKLFAQRVAEERTRAQVQPATTNA